MNKSSRWRKLLVFRGAWISLYNFRREEFSAKQDPATSQIWNNERINLTFNDKDFIVCISWASSELKSLIYLSQKLYKSLTCDWNEAIYNCKRSSKITNVSLCVRLYINRFSNITLKLGKQLMKGLILARDISLESLQLKGGSALSQVAQTLTIFFARPC